MFEKAREWTKEKVKRGREWAHEHRGMIGVGVGVLSTVAVKVALDRLFIGEGAHMTMELDHEENVLTVTLFSGNRFGFRKYTKVTFPDGEQKVIETVKDLLGPDYLKE